MLDPLSPTPIYVQLADVIAKRIETGELPPNRPIPSESTLQQEYGVARGTVRAAVRLLRERGLVMTVPQRGTYVSDK
ncbi:GntR family transcriptional regulator [Micromonospora vinacea]|uniref:GntR family transcriptional regulator n=1 Tax=Micromonospora vinacea TaxID=709878 RepID=A0ABS0JV03_9ACTN|nr:winged helix-turn-helix domain-containing protein [Micromonospora vinacea]MBG6100183.1 GntR family transcriptional regulator [Micromonospora vinacea]WSZ76861.1 winged helix-turn-helix domain-containing protein [Micromonospora sp. NBC_00860]